MEALFNIILSKFDGNIEGTNTWTPCYKAKRYLQSLVTTSVIDLVESDEYNEQDPNNTTTSIDEYNNDDENTSNTNTTFKDWAQSIADKSRSKVKDVQGISDNAQYLLALEPIIIRTFKLSPCWSAIMRQHFGFGEETASSSRIECNFNHIKNRVFKNSHLPLRVDSFVEELILYYRGDHFLLQEKNDNNMIKSHDQRSHSNNDNNTYDNQNNVSLSHSINNDNLMACEDDFLIISDTTFMNQNYVSLSRSNTENDLNTYSYDNELFDNFKSNEHSDATANSTDDSSLSSCISIDVNEHHTYNKSSIVNTELKNIQCQPCRNGDIPTSLHKCIQCKKAVHLFGCSIRIPNTNEGCGEPRICLDCDKKNSTIAENKATELE